MCRVPRANPDQIGEVLSRRSFSDRYLIGVSTMESQPSPDAITRSWDWGDRVATELKGASGVPKRPSSRAELERTKPDDRPRVLPELIGLGIVYRRRAGEDVSLTDYERLHETTGTRATRLSLLATSESFDRVSDKSANSSLQPSSGIEGFRGLDVSFWMQRSADRTAFPVETSSATHGLNPSYDRTAFVRSVY